jgi:glutamate synthase domain-containing protein 2/glutamate synthase domain-containing protein 1/glutamate synthase domain-containing protein 3
MQQMRKPSIKDNHHQQYDDLRGHNRAADFVSQPFSDVDERHPIDVLERDACALICAVRKGGQPTHGNVKRTIEGLARMGHRTGYIDGEGDGVGILTDIPRLMWNKRLSRQGLRSSLVTDRNFWVAHLMIPHAERSRAQALVDNICGRIAAAGLQVLMDEPGMVNPAVLGPIAEKHQPVFWQIAGMNGQVPTDKLDQTLFDLQVSLERSLKVHFPSFSAHSAVYKVQGTVEILRRYYPELRDPDFASTVTLGHARYSTNTNPIFERAQPFGLLGHNGEFNTISRFRLEAEMLGIPLDPNNSDSQDVDRFVQALCMKYGLDLIEAMEYIFPPFEHDLIEGDPKIHALYQNIRQAFGPFAQGPAAIAARLNDLCVFSVDALGLRPLWFGETEKEYFATSERGVYPLDAMSIDPKPMAPGEKIALRIRPGHSVERLDYPAIQRYVYNRHRERTPFVVEFSDDMPSDRIPVFTGAPTNGSSNGHSNGYTNGSGNGHNGSNGARTVATSAYGTPVYSGGQSAVPEPAVASALVTQQTRAVAVADAPVELETGEAAAITVNPVATQTSEAVAIEENIEPAVVEEVIEYDWKLRSAPLNNSTMAALGWERYHTNVMESIVEAGKEQIGSLGWDGPIAALSNTRVNVSDYFKEVVAVVTNPAIDREREGSQFSTRMVLGRRPLVGQLGSADPGLTIQIGTPLLAGGHADLGDLSLMRAAAQRKGATTLEDLLAQFGDRAVILSMSAALDERVEEAINRIAREAVDAALNGAAAILLDDSQVYSGECLWVDPILLTAAVDKALRQAELPDSDLSVRRSTGIIVRSGALRDLHDLAMVISMGANAVAPYAMYAVGLGIAPRAPKDMPTPEEIVDRMATMVGVLTSALEKVTSTIGCHELRGYGHSFGAIGLSKSIASIFGMPNYYGSEGRGLTWGDVQTSAEERAAEMRGEIAGKMANPERFYPKMWKKAEDVALGEGAYEAYNTAVYELEQKQPVSIRHILGFKTPNNSTLTPEDIDVSIKEHSLPTFIGAMSFGSQGELSYKAYAEAAYRLNIVCVNGEGGELQDIMGKYPKNRGQQVASARFGVNIEFLNSVGMIEIKIGQGAKPGEGGHLPGFKVTEQVAAARRTVPGVALISPSNNHDLYSIEDLAQLIDELKTANPHARISVKVPVVPGIGIIAVGIVKAGANIVSIAGYEGGTGAARAHSLRHVGLPAEVGVWLAHRALIESGLRDDVEIWTDGGMKSGRDIIKMMCLGANRVGFGTLAMVAVGCTICRKCQEGTCHVGITTHIKTREEAALKGLKSFEPRDADLAVQGIVNVFKMIEQDLREWSAKLGVRKVTDFVGRTDLLEQIALHDSIDLGPLLKRVPQQPKMSVREGGPRLTRPRNTLSKQITAVVAESVAHGDYEMTYDDEQVMAMDRALGTHLSGALKRNEFPGADLVEAVHLSFSNSAIPGNGVGAFLDAPVDILVEGGAQDGVGKCARGGSIAVLKGLNHNGVRLDGSVGKSFAYGAQGGTFIVQGNADTRACIRLSGADVIFGGEVTSPLRDQLGGLAARANLKGYACEYMTSGRVLVLGDPGPWVGAGMTGGVIYQRIQPEMGLTVDAIRRRIAPGSVLKIQPLDEQDVDQVHELLNRYIHTLEVNNQGGDATEHLYDLLRHPEGHFVKLVAPGA